MKELQSKIHLRRTGLIVFSARILSIFTGMLFLVMITGWLSPTKFGLWEVILSYVAFASYPSYWLGFWATREIARGRMIGRTVVLMNLVFSVGAACAFLAYSIMSYSRFQASFAPFLLAVMLIPLVYWNQAVNSVASGYKPEAVGYSILFSETAKLLVAYVALFIFKLGIDGAILGVVASYVGQGLVITALVGGAVSEPLSLEAGRRWISDSWVPAFYSLGTTISAADTVAASLVTGGTFLTGYYQAAFQIGLIVSYSMYLSSGLYPLLLRGGSDTAANVTLDLILMFGMPMAVGVIVLAPRLLALLSPAYVTAGNDVSLALCILAVYGLASAVSGFFDSTLMGKETADLVAGRDFRTYLGSAFSFVAAVNLGYAIAYIASVILTTGLGTALGLSISAIVAIWAACQVGLLVVVVLVKLRRLRKAIALRLPSSLPKYLLASLVMTFSLYLLSSLSFPGSAGRLVDGVRIFGIATAGAGVYFLLLILVDGKSRRLASEFLHKFS